MPLMMVPTDLSQAEIANLGTALAHAVTEHAKVTLEKKVANDGFKARLDGLNSRIAELTDQIETGRGEVEMDVEERPRAPGVIDLFRAGTDEKVGERPMRVEDRQGEFRYPAADDDDRDLADEQAEAGSPEEAEALRDARLSDEERERLVNVGKLAAELAERVVLSALEGGGWLSALDLEYGETLRESGSTEESARDAVLKLYFDNLVGKEENPPRWGDVLAARALAAEAREPVPAAAPSAEAEIEAIAAEQAEDAKADRIAKGGGLKAPKRKKRESRVVIVSQEGVEEEVLGLPGDDVSNEAGAPSPGGGGAPAETPEQELCLDDCMENHQHTSRRVAF